MTPRERLVLARQQLARVQAALVGVPDWSDVTLYGFYALENAVAAAADFCGVPWKASHPSKVQAATVLHKDHGLPDVTTLLIELNGMRKSSAYGETSPSTAWTPDDIAAAIEDFVAAVDGLDS